ncbi:hypothetical protein CEXT_12941 [Caerostris extrusa]|uniref:Uncharacterized protein n=1 Tax=Caerostris extrusa TaxID=172846 RepID=A0AAV4VBV8_CAEEX|nr:hypothetical protein CEXT_12941 [Caerostris extrusa]
MEGWGSRGRSQDIKTQFHGVVSENENETSVNSPEKLYVGPRRLKLLKYWKTELQLKFSRLINSDRRKNEPEQTSLGKNQEHSQTINDKLEFERHIPNNQSNPTDAGSNFDSNCLRNSNNLQLVPKNSDRRKRSKNKHRRPRKRISILGLVDILLDCSIPQSS